LKKKQYLCTQIRQEIYFMTYREIVYMILDQAKLLVDDSKFNEEHVLFLVDKMRASLLSQKYKTVKLEVPESNYQTLCLGLEDAAPVEGKRCEGAWYLRSTVKLPKCMTIGNDTVSPYDYYQGINISLISRERMRYVGFNRFLNNIIYCSIGPDGYLYLKSNNPQFKYLSKVKVTAVFEDTMDAAKYVCDGPCEILDNVFPLEDTMVNLVIENVLKELVPAAFRPTDSNNDANDDMPRVAGQPKTN